MFVLRLVYVFAMICVFVDYRNGIWNNTSADCKIKSGNRQKCFDTNSPEIKLMPQTSMRCFHLLSDISIWDLFVYFNENVSNACERKALENLWTVSYMNLHAFKRFRWQLHPMLPLILSCICNWFEHKLKYHVFFISGNLCCVLASAFVENRNRDFVIIVRLANGSHSNSIDKLHLIPLSVLWDAGNQIILL